MEAIFHPKFIERVNNFLGYNSESNLTWGQKWQLIVKVVFFDYALATVAFLLTLFVMDIDIVTAIDGFKAKNIAFFKPFNISSVEWFSFQVPLFEEFKYRIYLYAGILYLRERVGAINQRYKDPINVLLWILLIIPTAYWAWTIHYLGFPVFMVGLTWGWLIIKTKRIWPALIAHSIANLTLYILVKILNYWEIFDLLLPSVEPGKAIQTASLMIPVLPTFFG